MTRDQVNELKVLDAELAKDSMKGLWACEERVAASVFIARRAADSESKDERRRARL